MQIRKFEAEDMPQALRAIREEMGPNAVVLSTREVRKKGGMLGILTRPTLEVMVAVDSPGLDSPNLTEAPPSPSPSQGFGGRRAQRQVDFDAVLREMGERVEGRPVVPPVSLLPMGIPPDGPDDEMLWEELRAIRESMGALRAKVMSFAPPSESADGQIYEELRAIRESVVALRAKVISLAPPSEPMDGQIYEALRAIRESMGVLRAKVGSLTPSSESLEAPIYEALCAVKESVDLLRTRSASFGEFPRIVDLAPDARIYEELRAIQSSIFAIPSREIVHVETSRTEGAGLTLLSGTEGASGVVSGVIDTLVYDELRAIRESVSALQARVGGDEVRLGGAIYQSVQSVRESVAALMVKPQEGVSRSEMLSMHQELRAIKESLREIKGVDGARDGVDDRADLSEALRDIKNSVSALAASIAAPRPETPSPPPQPSLEDIAQIVTRPNRMLHDTLMEIKASIAAQATAQATAKAVDLPAHSPVYERLHAIESSLSTLRASIQAGNALRLSGMKRTQEEMQDIRESVGVQQYRNELSALRPILIGLFDKLIANGLSPAVAVELFRSVREKLSSEDLWKDDAVQEALKQAIQEAVYVSGPIHVEEGTTKVFLLVGSSGAGRKMTLAKLAAREKERKVTVVSLASEEAAARLSEQINRTGVPIPVRSSEGALQEAIALRSEGEVIFVDVPEGGDGGQEGLDADKVLALKALSGVSVETHLVLPASAPESDLFSRVGAASLPVDFLLFTKLDEARMYGPLFNVMRKTGKPLSYFTTGIRMPEDVEMATRGRVAELLLRQALRIDLTEGIQANDPAKDNAAADRMPRVISVTSGKGGVGKTNVVANLAMAFSKLGKRVLVLDADLGLGNLDVLFGVMPQYTLEHVLAGQKRISEVLVQGPGNIQILPTSSGTGHLHDLTSEQKLLLLSELDRLETAADVFLIDTGAGIGSTVLYFNTAAQEIILVVTPEPTSLADAYALMKVMSKQHGEKRFNLIVNMVKSESEAQAVVQKLSLVCEQFLDVAIEYIGSVPFDDYLRMAVCTQKSVVDAYPHARSSTHFMQIGRKILQKPIRQDPKGNIQYLWRRLLSKASA